MTCARDNDAARAARPVLHLERMLIAGSLAAPGRCPGVRRRHSRLLWSIALLVMSLALAVLPLIGPRAGEPDAAGVFITRVADVAIEQVITADSDPQRRRTRLRALLAENVDIPAIGRFVLGRYWRAAAQVERDAFLEVFRETLVHRLMVLLSDHAGERLIINQVRSTPDDPTLFSVMTRLERPSGELVAVAWQVRARDGSYRIVDVVPEGVSMALTLRAEYRSYIVRHGGSVEALIEGLRERLPEESLAASGNAQTMLQ